MNYKIIVLTILILSGAAIGIYFLIKNNSITTTTTPVNCDTLTKGPFPQECINKWWTETGCVVNNSMPDKTIFWDGQEKQGVLNDMIAYNSLSDNTHRTSCYGTNKNTWPEVFYVQPGYIWTKSEGDSVCSKYNNSKLASMSQLNDAYNKGAQWCGSGWVSDDQFGKYPMQQGGIPGCSPGGPGIQTYLDSNVDKAGVNCYGPKPQQGTSDVFVFSNINNKWSQYD